MNTDLPVWVSYGEDFKVIVSRDCDVNDRCADSHIKCAPRAVVKFQFKNTSNGMDESAAKKEAIKSVAEGFAVYLVIVCVKGNNSPDDKIFEDKASFPGVTVILLSKASVQYFLGKSLVETFSSASALVESTVRLGVSPIILTEIEQRISSEPFIVEC